MSSGPSAKSLVYILVHLVLFLAGAMLTRNSSLIWQSVGASLIAAGVTGWVVFVYINISERRAESFELLTRFGFVGAFEARAARIKDEYDSRLNAATEQIDVLGFGLKALWEDYHEQFSDWKRKCEVRILLMDPRSSYADQRDKEEQEIEGSIRRNVKRFLKETEELRSAPGKHSFQVRLYKCLPAVNVFRIDDEMFWGPYLVRSQSRNAPTFIVGNGGILFRRLGSHFDEIWKSDQLSRAIEPSDLED